MPQLTQDACESFFGYGSFLKYTKTCFGSLDGGFDACGSDAGAPLVIPDEYGGRATQVGIVSYGNGCGQTNSPTVYTRVDVFSTPQSSVRQLSHSLPPGPGPNPGNNQAWLFSVAPEIECIHTCPAYGCINKPRMERNYTDCAYSVTCINCDGTPSYGGVPPSSSFPSTAPYFSPFVRGLK